MAYVVHSAVCLICMPSLHTCCRYLVKQRMPPDKRTRALGLIYSGHQLGSVLSLLLSPGLIESRMGWPAVFYVYGALGFVWLALWWPLVVTPARAGIRKLPAADGKLGQQLAAGNLQTATDRQLAATNKKDLAADGKVAEADGKLARGLEGRPMLLGMPWRRMAGNRVVWALLVAHCNMGECPETMCSRAPHALALAAVVQVL